MKRVLSVIFSVATAELRGYVFIWPLSSGNVCGSELSGRWMVHITHTCALAMSLLCFYWAIET